MGTLAHSRIRIAGQYQRDQRAVWTEVSKVNASHGIRTPSRSLVATLEDPQIAAQVNTTANVVVGFFTDLRPRHSVVGFGYAVNGKLQGVRWFANHHIFALVRASLVKAAVFDALTARSSRSTPSLTSLSPEAVVTFVAQVEFAKAKRSQNNATVNTNEYVEVRNAYGSKTLVQASPSGPSVPLSADYVAK